MCVGEEEIVKRKRHAIPHHLPLRPFATVKKQGFTLSVNGQRADGAVDGGAGGGRSEEADNEGHAANIDGAAPCLL